MKMFFIERRGNDHSKCCIHHENYNYYVNQKTVVYRLRDYHDSNNNSCSCDYNRNLHCVQCLIYYPISLFLGRFE